MNELQAVDSDRRKLQKLTVFAVIAFAGAFLITLVMLLWSYTASDETANRLASAGSFAAGGAAAWAFIVAIIALFISIRSEESYREQDRHEARLLQAQDVEAQYDLQVATKAIDSVVAMRRLRLALERVMEAASLEITQALHQVPIAPHGRHQTWYAMNQFVATVESAESVGALEVCSGPQTVYTNNVTISLVPTSAAKGSSADDAWSLLVADVLGGNQSQAALSELRLSPATAILELAADAAMAVEIQDQGIGMRWLRLQSLLRVASVDSGMVYASGRHPSSEIFGKAEWVIHWLERADVNYVLDAWAQVMKRS